MRRQVAVVVDDWLPPRELLVEIDGGLAVEQEIVVEEASSWSEREADAGVEVEVERELGRGDLRRCSTRLAPRLSPQLVEKPAADLGQQRPGDDGIDALLVAGGPQSLRFPNVTTWRICPPPSPPDTNGRRLPLAAANQRRLGEQRQRRGDRLVVLRPSRRQLASSPSPAGTAPAATAGGWAPASSRPPARRVRAARPTRFPPPARRRSPRRCPRCSRRRCPPACRRNTSRAALFVFLASCFRGGGFRSTVASARADDGFAVAANEITSGRVSVPRDADRLARRRPAPPCSRRPTNPSSPTPGISARYAPVAHRLHLAPQEVAGPLLAVGEDQLAELQALLDGDRDDDARPLLDLAHRVVAEARRRRRRGPRRRLVGRAAPRVGAGARAPSSSPPRRRARHRWPSPPRTPPPARASTATS